MTKRKYREIKGKAVPAHHKEEKVMISYDSSSSSNSDREESNFSQSSKRIKQTGEKAFNKEIKIKNVSVATQTDDISITQDIIKNNNYTNNLHVKTDVYLVPQVPKLPKTLEEKESTRRLIVVLDKASLATYKVPNSKPPQYQLINSDDHQRVLSKLGYDNTMTYRPDITHQVRNKFMYIIQIIPKLSHNQFFFSV